MVYMAIFHVQMLIVKLVNHAIDLKRWKLPDIDQIFSGNSLGIVNIICALSEFSIQLTSKGNSHAVPDEINKYPLAAFPVYYEYAEVIGAAKPNFSARGLLSSSKNSRRIKCLTVLIYFSWELLQ